MTLAEAIEHVLLVEKDKPVAYKLTKIFLLVNAWRQFEWNPVIDFNPDEIPEILNIPQADFNDAWVMLINDGFVVRDGDNYGLDLTGFIPAGPAGTWIKAWNDFVERMGWKKFISIKRRLQDGSFAKLNTEIQKLEHLGYKISDILDAIEKQPFTHQWIHFYWILKPENINKLLEMSYLRDEKPERKEEKPSRKATPKEEWDEEPPF